jgi:hypothetical protein
MTTAVPTKKTISQKKLAKYVKHLMSIQDIYVREELHYTTQQIADLVHTIIPHLKWEIGLNEEYENTLYLDRGCLNQVQQVLQPEYHYLADMFINVVVDD